MENTNADNASSALYDIAVTEAGTFYLREAAKWAKFLSILGFIGSAFAIIMGLFAGSIMSALTMFGAGAFEEASGLDGAGAFGTGVAIIFGIVFVLVGVLYIFPSLYLYRFSEKTRIALATMDSRTLTEALKNQKSFFKFWGVYAAIVIGLYLLNIVVSILSLAAFA